MRILKGELENDQKNKSRRQRNLHKNQKGYTPLKEVLVETFAEIEKLYNQKEPITGIPTGFADLDYKTARTSQFRFSISCCKTCNG